MLTIERAKTVTKNKLEPLVRSLLIKYVGEDDADFVELALGSVRERKSASELVEAVEMVRVSLVLSCLSLSLFVVCCRHGESEEELSSSRSGPSSFARLSLRNSLAFIPSSHAAYSALYAFPL